MTQADLPGSARAAAPPHMIKWVPEQAVLTSQRWNRGAAIRSFPAVLDHCLKALRGLRYQATHRHDPGFYYGAITLRPATTTRGRDWVRSGGALAASRFWRWASGGDEAPNLGSTRSTNLPRPAVGCGRHAADGPLQARPGAGGRARSPDEGQGGNARRPASTFGRDPQGARLIGSLAGQAARHQHVVRTVCRNGSSRIATGAPDRRTASRQAPGQPAGSQPL